MKLRINLDRLKIPAVLLVLVACVSGAAAQENSDKKPEKKPGFVWTIKTRPILNLSLKAEKASMAEVAHALSERLKVPVFLGPERQKELISIEFSELTLEPALQLLSPTVYVDYELDTGSSNPPKALGITFSIRTRANRPLPLLSVERIKRC